MAKISNTQYAIVLYEAAKDLQGADLKQTIDAFVKILAREHKLRQAEAIIIEFEKYAREQAGLVDIAITSAAKLESSLINKIKKTFGDKVEVEEKVDKGLIGGIRVKMEDKILDASVRTQLFKLKQQLI